MTQFERGDSRYEELRQSAVWNGIVPARFPEAIACPNTPREVADLVRSARAAGRRIAVRSGGHNWRGAFLRDGGLLIDMRNLDDVEVDAGEQIAQVGPGATHRKLADAIVPHGLGFPIGHCPTVGLGGYLLAGGYGWNPRSWGPAVWSVRALDVVTLEGEEIHIDADSHPDLYWAARGGSSGFPAVVTRFHLDLQPLPQIRALRTSYPLERLPELLAWSAEQRDRPSGVEITILAVRPPEAPDRPAAVVQATTFGDTDDEAQSLLATVVEDLPLADQVVEAGTPYATSLNTVEGAAAWIEGRRYSADMCFVDDGYHEIARRTVSLFERAPSALSRVIFAWVLYPDRAPEIAQTCHGDLTVNVYSIWGEGETDGDAANEQWTRELMAQFQPWIMGFYAGEADLSVSEDRASQAYPAEKWRRLNSIREQYDPTRAKFGFISES